MPARLDDLRILHALPAPHLVLDRDLVVVQANPAYLRMVGLEAGELIGRPVTTALPPGSAALGEDGVPQLLRCFEQVLTTGRPGTTPVERFPVIDLRTGEAAARWLSSVVVPVLDELGRVELLVQRVEEVVGHGPGADGHPSEAGGGWRARALAAETELTVRAREVKAVRVAERARAAEVAALADAAVQVAVAQDVAELTDVLVDRVLAALGAQGGAVAVRDGDVVRLTLTDSLGVDARRQYSTLPLHGGLPGSVSTVTGRPVLLPDLQATAGFGHGMAQVARETGCQAWASLPLTTTGTDGGAQVLGSLLVGWAEPQTFDTAQLGVLEAFAAQCAQALARLQAQEAERARARETSELAQALQRALLSEPAQPDGLDVVTRYRPAVERVEVGGDWYDSFVTAVGLTTLVVGDVCGHDRDAAAAMGQVRNLLRGLAFTVGEPPAIVLGLLDRAIVGLRVQTLVTAVVAVVEQDDALRAADRHRVRWSNAGHPPPVLLHPDGRAELLVTDADLLLGLDSSTLRQDHTVELAAGSTLLLYTDGLVERRGAHLDDGLAWLVASVADLAGAGPGELCDALLQQIAGEAEDDVVLLALRV